MSDQPFYPFLKESARCINTNASNTLVLSGNIHDLFFSTASEDYLTLPHFLKQKWNTSDKMILEYKVSGLLCFPSQQDRASMKKAWTLWKLSLNPSQDTVSLQNEFESNLFSTENFPTASFELLRQFCICSRAKDQKTGENYLQKDLIILINSAEILIPEGNISDITLGDRHRMRIALEWFSDPDFIGGPDTAVLLTESTSLISSRISRLPFVRQIQIPLPDKAQRLHYISHFGKSCSPELKLWSTIDEFSSVSAGLNLYELRQIMKEFSGNDQQISASDVISRVELFIKNQLGEDVVEFKKPEHDLDRDVIGSEKLKCFLNHHFIPRIKEGGAGSIAGAAVSGPVGSGKTYIFEAVAAKLGIPVLVLKNIRSQWFGQTDVIFEKLKMILEALHKAMIFVDEADTQFGSVSSESHSTEKRLTGKIQNMMADPVNRGKIVWLLLTARIHQLSPDLRRPGRAGDLIIPVFDPDEKEHESFLKWVFKTAGIIDPSDKDIAQLKKSCTGFYPGVYSLLRSEIKARMSSLKKDSLLTSEICALADDIIPGSISSVRRYQTLQAMVNCTRKSLLPIPYSEEVFQQWSSEIRSLEIQGIR